MTYKTKDVIENTTIVLMLVILFLSIAIEAFDAGLLASVVTTLLLLSVQESYPHQRYSTMPRLVRQASVDFCHRCGMAE